MSGKRQNAVWSQTTSGGLFYIQFQWDAVEYAKVADPDYSTFQISYGHKGDYYQRDRSNRLYLVPNIMECLRGGRPIVKEADGDVLEFTKRLTEWVKNNSPFAHTILTKSSTIYTTEVVCALGLATLV